MTSNFNLKQAQFRINEKMLQDNRDKLDTKAIDDTGNLDWRLKDVRKDPSGDRTQESRLDDVRMNDNEQPILEAAFDNAKNTLNDLRIDSKDTLPLMDYSVASDVEREKDFKKADQEDKKDRNTEFWDKYIGVQLTNKKTTITNNTQPSQLLSNYETREDMLKQNKSTKTASILTSLMDADAMLYHIYRTASTEEREISEIEKQQVEDINSGKIRLLAQLPSEDQFSPQEWDEEGRAEKLELMSDEMTDPENGTQSENKHGFNVGDEVWLMTEFRGEKAIVKGFETGTLNQPFIIVRRRGSSGATAFSPHELRKVNA